MKHAAALSLLILLGAPAVSRAAFTQAQLAAVYVDAKPNAQLPLAASFVDLSGHRLSLADAIGNRPAVVVFADYTCTTLCGPILAFAAGALEKTGLTPNRDFRLVVIGIDPKDTAAAARAMKSSHVGNGTAVADATAMLTGNADTIAAMTTAAGYHYAYDKSVDQFAHPAVAYVVTAQGRVSRILSGLGLNPTDLRLALVDAGHGRVGTIADRIRLLCYCFDPATGLYSAAISRIMLGAGIVTVTAMVGGISFLAFALKRRTPT
jgi:protein SCO1/2